MITSLEPDILECEVKWALESITTNKASGGDGIPAELFQILNTICLPNSPLLSAGAPYSSQPSALPPVLHHTLLQLLHYLMGAISFYICITELSVRDVPYSVFSVLVFKCYSVLVQEWTCFYNTFENN